MPTTFEEKLASEYSALSTRLKAAADYIAGNQVDAATRSLRSISGASGIAPATFSRLAKALGFASYEELREMLRGAVGRQVVSFSDRAGQMQADARRRGTPPFLARQSGACASNIEQLGHSVEPERLELAVDLLHKARRVVLLGSLSSTGFVEYMAYLANFFSTNWDIVGQAGRSLGSDFSGLGPDDVLLIITKPPFSKRTIEGAEMAARMGAHIIIITDTHACPALAHADVGFIVPTDSPQFFSSYAATLVLIETMIGMLVSRAGPGAKDRIAEIERLNERLGETCPG